MRPSPQPEERPGAPRFLYAICSRCLSCRDLLGEKQNIGPGAIPMLRFLVEGLRLPLFVIDLIVFGIGFLVSYLAIHAFMPEALWEKRKVQILTKYSAVLFTIIISGYFVHVSHAAYPN
ncbi:hypothetical protein CHELA40_11006 [Chelatococcus asaccharovorans]|nr:hypothetical protein CHELA40_11006 [Chelatococcus asaccharovorans]CAH1685609.1 hypothetical protein CHELA17_64592 [Chelatococcus asaccharovorans]